MTELSKRTWQEASELLGPDTVAIIPVGSTEPHGPHLPLDTDVTIAQAQARAAAARLEEAGVRVVILPPIAYGVTRFTEGFAGWISLRPGTLWALLEDLMESLGEQGVQRVVLSNGHLEPEHIEILRGIEADYPEAQGERPRVIFPDNTRRKWAGTLGDEFKSGDCHAGRYETSIVLEADPQGVRAEAQAALEPVAIGLIDKMRSGARTFVQCGAGEAYCGDPASASAGEGAELVQALATMIVESVREAWPELFPA